VLGLVRDTACTNPSSSSLSLDQFYCCDRKSPRGMCAKLRTMAASNNRVHPTRSLYYCLFTPHIYIIVLRAHPIRGESHNQRNATGEVATTSPPFYNEPHRSYVLLCEGWTQHNLHILVTAPFYCDRKSPRGMCAKLCTVAGSNKSSCAWSLLLLVRATCIYYCSSRTSRLWWIAQSMQRHQRGCNTTI